MRPKRRPAVVAVLAVLGACGGSSTDPASPAPTGATPSTSVVPPSMAPTLEVLDTEMPGVVESMDSTLAVVDGSVFVQAVVATGDETTFEVIRFVPGGEAKILERPKLDGCTAGVHAVASSPGTGDAWLLFSCLEWDRDQRQVARLDADNWLPVGSPFSVPGLHVGLTTMVREGVETVVAWGNANGCLVSPTGDSNCVDWGSAGPDCSVTAAGAPKMAGGTDSLLVVQTGEAQQSIVELRFDDADSVLCVPGRSVGVGEVVAVANAVPQPIAVHIADETSEIEDLFSGDTVVSLPAAAAAADQVAVGGDGSMTLTCWTSVGEAAISCVRT